MEAAAGWVGLVSIDWGGPPGDPLSGDSLSDGVLGPAEAQEMDSPLSLTVHKQGKISLQPPEYTSPTEDQGRGQDQSILSSSPHRPLFPVPCIAAEETEEIYTAQALPLQPGTS